MTEMLHGCSEEFSRCTCFFGESQSGKTNAAVELACRLSKKGESVLVLCATPDGVRDVRIRLDACGIEPDLIRLSLARDAALEVLADAHACGMLARVPRVLDEFEERFLMEDLRTLGIKGRRLCEVFEFLRAGWSRLADDDCGWLITLEEESVSSLVRDELRFIGGMLACEVGNLAVSALRENADIRKRHMVDHVIVDDFSLMDYASQVFSRLLARVSFSFTASPVETNPVFDEYPCFEGSELFLRQHESADVVWLEAPMRPRLVRLVEKRLASSCGFAGGVHAACGFLHDEGKEGKAEDGSVCVYMEADMGEECRRIVEVCARETAAGRDVLVTGSHGLWRNNVAKALSAAGLSVVCCERPIGVRDFRDERSCLRAMRKTLARLKENPRDGVAWRSLIGFGDYTARSAGLEELRNAVSESGEGLDEALLLLYEGRLHNVDARSSILAPLAASYARGRDMLESDCVYDVWPAAVMEGGEGFIRVCSPRQAAALRADSVVFGGFVSGAIPSRPYADGSLVGAARRQSHLADMRMLYSVVGCARASVTITGFSRCSLEVAERMGLRIAGIKLQAGMRVCAIEPSEYICFFEFSEF